MSDYPLVNFGGPLKPEHLRNLLAEHISQVPAGGEINWVSYYFRDRRLAKDLIQAHQRGVKVTVCLAAKPRSAEANDVVIDMLSGTNGIDDGLRLISFPGIPAPSGRSWSLQVHEKLYCFSHPQPIAFVGSFNPSGDEPEERPDLIEEIGDQDRAYNVLVGLTEPELVKHLIKHAQDMHQDPPGLLYRFSREANQELQGSNTTLYFWPRTGRHPLIQFLKQFGNGTRIRIAASHIRAKAAVDVMIALAERGANVEILAEPTFRRVTAKVEQALLKADIHFKRTGLNKKIPMHLKFVLVKRGNEVWTMFGSFNWTLPSFWLNHEIAAISSDPEIFNAFASQWEHLKQNTE